MGEKIKEVNNTKTWSHKGAWGGDLGAEAGQKRTGARRDLDWKLCAGWASAPSARS